MTQVFPSQNTDRDRPTGSAEPGMVDQPEAARPPSGSDQAREGRLVDALAVRGDEGRGTLR